MRGDEDGFASSGEPQAVVDGRAVVLLADDAVGLGETDGDESPVFENVRIDPLEKVPFRLGKPQKDVVVPGDVDLAAVDAEAGAVVHVSTQGMAAWVKAISVGVDDQVPFTEFGDSGGDIQLGEEPFLRQVGEGEIVQRSGLVGGGVDDDIVLS